ncbi:MAG: hypothetical protein II198_06445, partial [Bacteroidaceae bacterium]|nr:hypothetical protein [Bacteroidaceae bacterium]
RRLPHINETIITLTSCEHSFREKLTKCNWCFGFHIKGIVCNALCIGAYSLTDKVTLTNNCF